MEQRFAGWPYRLQWLISPNVTSDRKQAVAEESVRAHACCLGVFGRAFRRCFPDVGAVMAAPATSVLLTWEAQLRFSTAPVECEHKQVKDETASMTTGTTRAPAAWRAVCRHLHNAHLHRGGPPLGLPLKRVRAFASPDMGGHAWPEAPARLGQPALAADDRTSEQLATRNADLACAADGATTAGLIRRHN